MSKLLIQWQWAIKGPLHLGSGLAQAGYADRLIRMRDGRPLLTGDAVKGAIRASAERLARWLGGKSVEDEDEDRSVPKHRVLTRLFNQWDQGAVYRFEPAKYVGEPGVPGLVSQTAIDPDTSTALEKTLRISEIFRRGAEFHVRVTARGGDWSPGTPDYKDALFLLASIAGAGQIGGNAGLGFGQTRISGLDVQPASPAAGLLKQLDTARLLRAHIATPPREAP